MHVVKLLHNLLDNACQSIDTRLRRTLFAATETLTRCKELSIFGLGRNFTRTAKVKNNIKCIDRLFGNTHLQKKRELVYQAMTHYLVKGNKRPLILVDWSGLTRCGEYHFLRASISAKGRALTLYEQAYPLSEYTSRKTHREFLTTLKNMLPMDCKPIVITDAGFRNTWFRLVQDLGWDFMGRVRHLTQYHFSGENNWKPVKTLHEQATPLARYLGEMYLAKAEPLQCHAYLMKEKKKNRVKKNLAGKKIQSSVSKKHAKSGNEPWLIVSSLSATEISAIQVMQAYKKRMQIEESFRDLKNTRNGFSLRHCRSYQLGRLNIVLLMGALAMFVLWILGLSAKNKNLHYGFQANTERRWDVLSNVMIGWQVLQQGISFTKQELLMALETMIASAQWEEKLC
jgi:hypothetical protein